MATLVESSTETKEWLRKIRLGVAQKCPEVRYGESTYWAQFKSPITNRDICHLRVYKSLIVIFTKLDQSKDKRLKETRSTSRWADLWPSTFEIRQERALQDGVEIITRTFEYDRQHQLT